jgi:hypothetical protein
MPSGDWQSWKASWVGRYILDGYVIADEYRMNDASGNLVVFGLNFRAYDASRKVWNMKWLDALSGRWTELGPEALGGVAIKGSSISYLMKEPLAAHAYTRATYTPQSETRFTWRGESSNDATSWSEFMVIEAHRDGA